LEELVSTEPVAGTVGIAHTRWATHGHPSVKNAHPHLDGSGRIALVHNGIIENHSSIRKFLEREGYVFTSDTDTEALVLLIGYFYDKTGDFYASVRQALSEMIGTFGLVAICVDLPQTLVAARRGSPLIVGFGDNEYLVASDGSAIVEHTRQVVYLEDNEMAQIGPDGFQAGTIDDKLLEKQVDYTRSLSENPISGVLFWLRIS
jgi:glucosamine--fructose-6-phosphate aminotransferase (isomerizing)